MIDKYFDGEVCSFCGGRLEHSFVKYKRTRIPCYECKKCHSYFYEKKDYNKLKMFAKSEGRHLNSYVYSYNYEILYKNKEKRKNKLKKQRQINQIKRKKPLETYPVSYPRKNATPQIIKISRENINCSYFKNGDCLYNNNKCNPFSVRCKNYTTQIRTKNKKIKSDTKDIMTLPSLNLKDDPIMNVGVSVIVLTSNKKCIIENHEIQDVIAIVRIITANGKIIDYKMPAAYCNVCKVFFAIKLDYLKAKERGVILCQIIDKQEVKIQNGRIVFHGNESKIHRLGYNVKKNNGLTTEQRHIILANIIENNLATKHEILSNISIHMKQHQNQQNYANAVAAWKNDLEFLRTYEEGSFPQVRVKKLIMGRP